ncbi:hypothetical protein [Hymenobacter edaphi]|uniref:Uncharacterized protein n=1 Tax=Hymenobacter edaphi TaxID=2211146 RepID=A0A328BRW4_9BACT|nr:hypothetical protein [Hymenobacter edaphi]RAK69827.1 hypothetical protein DLM85_02945 [Hymenobacter edaphi]
MTYQSDRQFVTTSIWLMRIYFGTAALLLTTTVIFLLGAVVSENWPGALGLVLFGGAALGFGWLSTRLAQVALTPGGIEVRRLFGREVKEPGEFDRVEAFGSLIRIHFQDGGKVYGMSNSLFVREMMPELYYQAADAEWGLGNSVPGMRDQAAALVLLRERDDIALINQKIRAWVPARQQ